MHDNLCGFGRARIIFRQCRHGLDCSQRALLRIVRESRNGGRHLAQYVSEFSIWMKGKVSWPRSGLHLRKWRCVRCQRSSGRIEFVDQDVVEAKINRESESVVGRNTDPVRVWALLALLVDA